MTAVEVVPRKGLLFEHARFRQKVPGKRIGECPPEVFVVTSVRGSTVFYGPPRGDVTGRDRGKGRCASHRIDRAVFATIVGKVLPDGWKESDRDG